MVDDDETLHQESYFDAYVAVINSLDPNCSDFEFMWNNLRISIQITEAFTTSEKLKLNRLLQLVYGQHHS